MEVDPSARTEAGAAGGVARDLGPGMLIGKYRLDRVLGAGGMGVVWAAYDPDLERPVAIKVLLSVDDGATQRTRLLREARAMARLKHPNILTVYEVGTDRNRDYIAMELIDGADLDAWLKTRPPRAEIVAALFAAGRGLAAAHDAGLIHRDLKPHNILRGRDGSVYVTDFGLARGQIEDGAEVVQQPIAVAATAVASGSYPRGIDSVLDSPLTQTGVLIGTPAYMAPEQFAGRAPDPRTDQFAFCITAWEALTGARPFAGSTLDELRAAASGGVPAAAPGLSPRLRAVLVRGLAADPAQRWPDMRVLLREIEAALGPPRRSYMPLIVGTALATAAIAAGAVFFMNDPSAAQADDCGPPEDVFGSAWSAERRNAVVTPQKLGVEGMAAAAALDELRRKWLTSYEAACEMTPSAARHERLGCLLEIRDDTNEMTADLAGNDGKLTIGAVIPLTIAMGMCVTSGHPVPEIPSIPGLTAPSSEEPPSDPSDPWSPSEPRGPSGHPRPPTPPRPPMPPRVPPHAQQSPGHGAPSPGHGAPSPRPSDDD
jgi:eukaryotic-like serine/threonine-protein kinase